MLSEYVGLMTVAEPSMGLGLSCGCQMAESQAAGVACLGGHGCAVQLAVPEALGLWAEAMGLAAHSLWDTNKQDG